MIRLSFYSVFSFVLFSLLSACSESNNESDTRPYAIASAHPLATQAGIEILEQGGNAFDAAVAVTTTLAVVEPYSSGIGGGGFWLLHLAKDNRDIMIDGREVAPLAASRDMYLDSKGDVVANLSITGPLSAGIPGEPAAIVHLAKEYGNLPLSVSMAPAIRIANQGFEVTPHYQRMARFRLDALRLSPDAARIFLYNNDVPPLGHLIKQTDLANTLSAIAEEGFDGFYSGDIAKKILVGVVKDGGIWSEKDLSTYRIIERAPIVGFYQDVVVTSVPPPSSGGIALVTILNILEDKKWDSLSEVDQIHVLIEAMRRAYRDRAVYLGDTAFVRVPINKLRSKQYAKQIGEDIKLDKATVSEAMDGIKGKAGFHTTHFSIVDKEGNRVSATLSINYPFGSCYVAPGTGVLLNDEMDDFSSKPGIPNAYGLVGAEANAIEPGKRMLSSMSPTFIENDEYIAIIGTPGGSRIITMVLHGILAIKDKQTADQVVSKPRFHHQYLPDVVQLEPNALSLEIKNELGKRGHRFVQLENTYGNMQVIIINKKTGEITAASDPRGEGLSIVK